MPFTIYILPLPLPPSEKKQIYSLLLEPRYRECLEGAEPYHLSFGKMVAIGVEENDIPIGICLIGCYKDLSYAEIHSFFITPHCRQQGIGTQLLKAAEAAVLQNECSLVQIQYRKEDRTSPFLEKILKNEKWAGPKKLALRYFFDSWSFHPPWFTHPPTWTPPFSKFSWNLLKEGEKKEIIKNLNQGHFSSAVSPFQENVSEPINSIGLKYKKKIIGWMITHRIAHDTIRYTALYVQPEHQFRGMAIRLLVDAISLQQLSPIRWALFETNLLEASPSWTKFVLKRLAPYSQGQATMLQMWKSL